MLSMPRRVKFKKHPRGKRRGKASRGNQISFGSFGLKAETRAWITARQIEASRRAITRFLQRGGKVWIRIFPDKAVSKKGAETPMGSGKGAVDHYVAVVKPGKILFELDGISEETAREALKLAAYKLPIKTRILKRD